MKKLLFIVFIFSFIYIFAEETKKTPRYIESTADEVEFSFEKTELTTKGGKTKFDDVAIQANSIKKLEDKNVILAYDDIIFEQGKKNKVEADELEIDIDTKIAKIRNGRSYAEIPDAKTHHNKLYYGGKEFEARFPNKAIVKDAYFTTCDYVLEGKVPHYQLKSKKIKVYLEKRVVAYNTLLYIGKYPVMWFPFYITSLKSSDDEAPLFPRFGNDVEYGRYVVWGFDYGENDSKILNGSLALKLSQNKGFSIDSWINKYTIEKNKNYGELKLIDTILKKSKASERQHDFTHTHKYKNSKGELNWEYSNKSLNAMNGWTDEQIEKFRLENGDSKENVNEVIVYKLKTDFKQLGKKKEFDIFTDIEWTENTNFAAQDARQQSETDEEEAVIEPVRDVKRKIELSLKQDKKGSYMAYAYYKKYDDLNPGNSEDDKLSYQRAQKYDLDLHKLKIYPYYEIDEKDSYKPLTDTFVKTNFADTYKDNDGNEIDQIAEYDGVYAVKKYDIDKTEKYQLKVGDYKLSEKMDFSVGADYSISRTEKRLNQDMYYDGTTDNGFVLFNTEKVIKSINETETAGITLKQSSRTLSLSGGTTYVESKERVGSFDYNEETQKDESEYDETTEDSQNAKIKISDSKLKLGILGTLKPSYEIRRDWYVEKDIYTTQSYSIGHNKVLYDNTDDVESYFDLKLSNDAGYKYTWYEYDIGDRLTDYEETRDEDKTDEELIEEYWEKRLGNKTVKQEMNDTVNLDLGNISTDYTIKSTNDFDAFYADYIDEFIREKEYLENSFNFDIDKKTSLGLKLTEEKAYDERVPTELEFLNSDKDTFNITLKDGKRVFTYKNSDTRTFDRATKDYKNESGEIYYTDTEGTPIEKGTDGSYYYADGTKVELYKVKIEQDYLKLKDVKNQNYSYLVDRWKFLYGVSDTFERERYEDLSENKIIETTTINYGVTYSFGNKIKRVLDLSYKDYENKLNDEKSSNEFKLTFTFTDTRDVKEEIEEKDDTLVIEEILGMSSEEIQSKMDEINERDRRPSLGIDLSSLGEDKKEDKVENKKEYKFSLELENNKKYYREKDNYARSILDLVTGFEMTYNDYEFTYKYTQARTTAGEDITKKLHYSKAKVYMGKIDHRWGLGYEIKFDDAKSNSGEERRLQNYKISLDKEFHCNGMGLAFESDWDSDKQKYSNTWSINFFILAFPSKRVNVERVEDNDKHRLVGSVGI